MVRQVGMEGSCWEDWAYRRDSCTGDMENVKRAGEGSGILAGSFLTAQGAVWRPVISLVDGGLAQVWAVLL